MQLDPETWSNRTYFAIGALGGFALGFAGGMITIGSAARACIVAAVSAFVFGWIGIALRDKILDLIIFWWS